MNCIMIILSYSYTSYFSDNLHCRSNVDRYISTVSTFLINKTLIHVWTVYPFTRFIRRSVYQFINLSVYPVSVYPVPSFLPCHHSTSLCTDCIMLLYSPWKSVSLLVEPQLRYPDLGSWFWLVIVKLRVVDSDWLSSKINKFLTFPANVNKLHHAQELPLFSTRCCISFVQLDIILICNTLETFFHWKFSSLNLREK